MTFSISWDRKPVTVQQSKKVPGVFPLVIAHFWFWRSHFSSRNLWKNARPNSANNVDASQRKNCFIQNGQIFGALVENLQQMVMIKIHQADLRAPIRVSYVMETEQTDNWLDVFWAFCVSFATLEPDLWEFSWKVPSFTALVGTLSKVLLFFTFFSGLLVVGLADEEVVIADIEDVVRSEEDVTDLAPETRGVEHQRPRPVHHVTAV